MEEEKFEMDPMGDEITSDDKIWSLLGYIFGIVALIALLIEDKRDRPFIKFHAIQALMLWVVTVLLSWTMCLWVLPWGFGIYIGILAYQGQWSEVPVLTDFAVNQGWISKPESVE
jgi:uncharacterized membrane protein